MPDKMLQKELLKYAYYNRTPKRVNKFKLGEVFDDFNGVNKDRIIKNLERLVDEGLLYIDGNFIEDFKGGIRGYNYSVNMVISKKGITAFEALEKGIFSKIFKKIKNLNVFKLIIIK